MQWSEICDLAHCSTMNQVSSAPAKHDYIGVFPFSNTTEKLFDDGLYFGTVKDYRSLENLSPTAAFILFADEPLGETISERNLGIFNSAQEHRECFVAIQNVFMKDNRGKKTHR